MKFENLIPDLPLLYTKAKESFKECIRNKDNEFLKDEVSIPLEDIVVVEGNIKIVFFKRAFDHFSFEITLLLFDGDEIIGKYLYFVNESKEAVDDSLVFY